MKGVTGLGHGAIRGRDADRARGGNAKGSDLARRTADSPCAMVARVIARRVTPLPEVGKETAGNRTGGLETATDRPRYKAIARLRAAKVSLLFHRNPA